jgi:hypothetical protein
MIARGLLNFAILQMNREWVYPFWVHRQLDPRSRSYIPRSHNPLLLNVTHRNWTLLGSPRGFHEAIVDPRGMVTPLPREWSVDFWLMTDGEVFFPSLCDTADQGIDTTAPSTLTVYSVNDLRFELQSFVHTVRCSIDVLFNRAAVVNNGTGCKEGILCVAVRPFNPEGVAPVESIRVKSPRIVYVNGSVGVVFAEEPDGYLASNAAGGDIAFMLRRRDAILNRVKKQADIRCKQGLAHTVAAFPFSLHTGESKKVHCSIALETDRNLYRSPVKQSWRVSFERRQADQQREWKREIDRGAFFGFADKQLQGIFDACRLTLLQLHDGGFVSPGPFLYHTFWFRDAAVMLTALDRLGYPKRVGETIDTFPDRLTGDGFFRGPDGEWDSNGAVLWTVYRHFTLTRSVLWLNEWYPVLAKAAGWIQRMRRKTGNTPSAAKGLMPKSLSAEHLGMVDQYYWDSFWSLAGLRCIQKLAEDTGRHDAADEYRKECLQFERDIRNSLDEIEKRLGEKIIPATPTRPFDESAIGSVCAVYPLQLFDETLPHGRNTLSALTERYVDGKGFLHPFIHSGYNPYLTLHLAHGFLITGEIERAWDIAETVLKQATATGTYPEAIHPFTGGGTMGDGHHGWAAAEIVMFLRDCLVRENGNILEFFTNDRGRLIKRGTPCSFRDVPTLFGRIGVEIVYTSSDKCVISFSNKFFKDAAPEAVSIRLPFEVAEIIAGNPDYIYSLENKGGQSLIRLSTGITKVYLTIR